LRQPGEVAQRVTQLVRQPLVLPLAEQHPRGMEPHQLGDRQRPVRRAAAGSLRQPAAPERHLRRWLGLEHQVTLSGSKTQRTRRSQRKEKSKSIETLRSLRPLRFYLPKVTNPSARRILSAAASAQPILPIRIAQGGLGEGMAMRRFSWMALL